MSTRGYTAPPPIAPAAKAAMSANFGGQFDAARDEKAQNKIHKLTHEQDTRRFGAAIRELMENGENESFIELAIQASACAHSKAEEKRRKEILKIALRVSKEIAELNRQLAYAHKQIERLDGEIDAMKEKIEAQEEKMEALYGKDWKQKLKDGKIDPNDPEIAQYLLMLQELGLLKEERDIWRARESELQQLRDGKTSEIQELREDVNLSKDDKFNKGTALHEDGMEITSQQITAQQNSGMTDAEEMLELDSFLSETPSPEIDEEIGDFTKAIEAARNIDDFRLRLVREQELVSALSGDAKYQISGQEETAKFFDSNYFAALEAPEKLHAQTATADIGLELPKNLT